MLREGFVICVTLYVLTFSPVFGQLEKFSVQVAPFKKASFSVWSHFSTLCFYAPCRDVTAC